MSVGIAILNLNGQSQLEVLLPILIREDIKKRILVVDSSSTDNSSKVVESLPDVEWLQIPRSEFNHGATRELARQYLKTDIVVFLTQDVIPLAGFLKHLIKPIQDGSCAVTYARQLPHVNAGFFESFPRHYNYPEHSNQRTINDANRLGVFTFFCSDSCAAYSNAALDEIGGINPILTNEDYFTVAKLLTNGFSIAYTAESQVHHSHKYRLVEEFQRYFDTGYVRGENQWVNKLVGQAENRGVGFLSTMLKELFRKSPHLLPYALLQSATKWIGYRIGYLGPKLPLSLCKLLSSQGYYWNSRYCARNNRSN